MDPWTLVATAAVVAASAAFGAVLAATLVRAALAPGATDVASACALVVGALALGGVLTATLGGLDAGLGAPLSAALADSAPRSGAVVALAGALGPALAWGLCRGAVALARRAAERGERPVTGAAHRRGGLAAPGLVSALAAALGALVAVGGSVPWAALAPRALLAPVAGPLVAAAGAGAVLGLVTWVLRHATPEPVHRRSRALTPLTVVLLGVGAGMQVVALASLLVSLAAGRGGAAAPGGAVPGAAASGGVEVLLAAAVALGAGAWLVLALRRERPVARVPPVVGAVSQACAAAVLVGGAVLGALVPVRVAASAAGGAAAAVRGAPWVSARLLVLAGSAVAVVPLSGLLGLAVGAVLAGPA